MKDIMLALIFTSIAYIMISKVELLEESFDTKSKKTTVKKEKTVVGENKEGKQQEQKISEPPKAEADIALPSHCKDNDLDKEFLKEYDIDISKLEAIQTNVFDKYNYNVFYNELGENSVDIQGIHNSEVPGYEK
tara:strand:+ start:3462 stop:3863 length:402 start_codon:yes stop_codon:yes gene_type:complete